MTENSAELGNTSALVLCLSATPPVMKKASIVRSGPEGMELRLDGPEPALEKGMRVILEGGEEGAFRIKARVAELDGCRLRVKTERVVDIDKRDFPRVQGGISVRYRVITNRESEALAETWIAGEDVPPGDGGWREPDPFMDFSGSGLKFVDKLCCDVGDLLIAEMHVPHSENRWHVTARVVRVEPLGFEGANCREEDATPREATHYIAVRFERLPLGAAEALTAFTLRVQDALLQI